ncbi:MAG: ribonuclease HII [Betaproteobacteria bacterium]|nr:ribonuclease HII [Betaproteobacteria bacterium]
MPLRSLVFGSNSPAFIKTCGLALRSALQTFLTRSSRVQAGVDEAGRGPLAGPVCAAAVILGDAGIDGLADSKLLSARRRQALAAEIQAKSRAWGVGWASVAEIDELNILRATFMAMARAMQQCLAQLEKSRSIGTGAPAIPDSLLSMVLVDGNRSPADYPGPWQWPYTTKTIVKGDQTVACISAASILAKTARDQEMCRLDTQYPHYGFARHAGYGTKAHLQALAQHGPCAAHRKSFAPVKQLSLGLT